LHVRLVFVPLPHLLVHELLLTVLPAVLRFLCARSVTAWGRLLALTEEALQPHCTHDPIDLGEDQQTAAAEGNLHLGIKKTQRDSGCLTWVFPSY
jgi:hypothetical protein